MCLGAHARQVLVPLLVCTSSSTSIAHQEKESEDPYKTPPSLTAVLAEPERYEEKSLLLFGFYGGNSALFLTDDHEKHLDYTSAIAIHNAKVGGQSILELCGGHYTSIRGTLKRTESVSTLLGRFYILTEPQMGYKFEKDGKKVACWPPNKHGQAGTTVRLPLP